ncbi:MAG: MoaD/ThiS family protein [Planctomycetota bacterium]
MKVLIPTAFRKHTDGQAEISFAATSVREALDQLVERFPELEASLFDESRSVASFVNVFVNEENIRDLNQESTALGESDEVLLVPAIAGG